MQSEEREDMRDKLKKKHQSIRFKMYIVMAGLIGVIFTMIFAMLVGIPKLDNKENKSCLSLFLVLNKTLKNPK